MENEKLSSSLQEENEDRGSIEQYLTFLLKSETYGVQVKKVREVIEYERVYPVPGVPPLIRGVINLRGEVVPVIDLSERFFGYTNDVTRFTGIAVIELQDDIEVFRIGIVIDRVQSVIDIGELEIEPSPEFGTKIDPEYIAGVAKIGGKFIILLNIDRVLEVNELADIIGGVTAG